MEILYLRMAAKHIKKSKPLWAARLTAFRKTITDKQKDFASQLGLQPGTYRLYEAGARQPKFELLAALSVTFGLSLNYLIAGRGPPTIPPDEPFDPLSLPLSRSKRRRYLEAVSKPSLKT